MKILLMGFTKMKYMPYINFYLDNINGEENEVHILYWNRDLKDEELASYQDCVLHEFQCYQEDDVAKFSKIKSFGKYRSFAKKLLKHENFDFVFVLHSITGVLVIDVLKKYYTNKYILDYRDSTYEAFSPFMKCVATLTRHSYATFVSSDAFRRFLPEDCKEKIYTAHNLLTDSLSHRDEKIVHEIPSDKIRIAFWGFIRNEELNRNVIKRLCNDERFELHYYGREQQVALNLKAYSAELKATNVFFHGEYRPAERYEFVRQTDIIHNIFNDNNMMLAMGNKYYDGVIFRIPQICMKGSFMGDCAARARVGFLLDPISDSFANDIYVAYRNMDVITFREHCDKELQRVLEEVAIGNAIIQQAQQV